MRFERVPFEVSAELLDQPWVWANPAGDVMTAGVGDYRVTDPVSLTQWSLTPAALRFGYEPVSTGVYRSRGHVKARRAAAAEAHLVIDSIEGRETARPNDWIVTDTDGNSWVVESQWFAARYRAVD